MLQFLLIEPPITLLILSRLIAISLSIMISEGIFNPFTAFYCHARVSA